jgi:hypothetical protein
MNATFEEVRREVELGLTAQKSGTIVVTGEVFVAPEVSEEFHFDAARIGVVSEVPTLQVPFHWDGYPKQFGMQTALDSLAEESERCKSLIGISWSALFCIDFEEDLLAYGREIDNAEKHPEGGVVWLTWPTSRWIAPG